MIDKILVVTGEQSDLFLNYTYRNKVTWRELRLYIHPRVAAY